MNKKYVLHPGDYAIGENEKLYADMAAKGWLLEKRGVYLSRCRKAAPENRRYRLELSSPDTLNGETGLPEEQRALYEECGWSYVTGRVWIHVFSAPEGSAAPEIYTAPRQQADTLKYLRRRYYFGWLPPLFILLFNLSMTTVIFSRGENFFVKLAGGLKMAWVTETAFIALCAVVLLWTVYASLHGAVCVAMLRARLRRGEPIDHAPKNRHLPHRILSGLLLALCVIGALLSVVQWAQNTARALPPEADGPYLLLQDLCWSGERTKIFTSQASSYVKTKHSLIADQWLTYECVSGGYGFIWMYQDIYELPNETQAASIVPALMDEAVFTQGRNGFTRVDVPGLDLAYRGNSEYIAVKGSTAYFIKYSESESSAQADVLSALAERL